MFYFENNKQITKKEQFSFEHLDYIENIKDKLFCELL